MSATTEDGTWTTNCPRCGMRLSVDERFVTWCHGCEWNVDPIPPPQLSWSQRHAADYAARRARRLFEEVSEFGTERARRRTRALKLVAGSIHLMTLVTLAAGLALVLHGFGTNGPFRWTVGLLAIAMGLLLQPFRIDWTRQHRTGPAPLMREDAPVLFAAIDEIATAVGASGVDAVSFNRFFDATIVRHRQTGWTLTLGLPLWSVLTPDERTAMIAHELGHQVNRDQRRKWLVRTAAVTMSRWAQLLDPRSRITPTIGLPLLGGMLASAVMFPFASAAAGLARLLAILARRQGQSAEYYADLIAARAAGTEATHSMLEKTGLNAICVRGLVRAVRFGGAQSIWEELSRFAAGIPESERERQRRVGRLRLPAVDSAHPPTQLRADLIANQPYSAATVHIAAHRWDAIDRELGPVKDSVAAEARSALRS